MRARWRLIPQARVTGRKTEQIKKKGLSELNYPGLTTSGQLHFLWTEILERGMQNNINYPEYKRHRAQSALEYAMVIVCIVAALMAMQIYIKRGLQGRFRDAADEIGEQYSAKTTNSNLTQTYTSNVTVNGTPQFIDVTVNGSTEKREIMEVTRNENTTMGIERGGYEQTGNLSSEELFE